MASSSPNQSEHHWRHAGSATFGKNLKKKMPTIFEKHGYKFSFYSNEHLPPHVHVWKGGGEAIFLIGPEVELREASGMKVRQLAPCGRAWKENREIILKAWNDHINR